MALTTEKGTVFIIIQKKGIFNSRTQLFILDTMP